MLASKLSSFEVNQRIFTKITSSCLFCASYSLKIIEMKTLQLEIQDGIAIVTIDNGKVNAIDTALAKELWEVFVDLEKNETVKGAVLSGRPNCFSAGLNILKLFQDGLEGTRIFWVNYLNALQTMIRFPKPLVSAITGYAPAGGTILALCADYKVMAKGSKHVIGMNEFKNSMQIPEMMCHIYSYFLGEKEAWIAVQNSQMYNSDEALAIGLVQESVEVTEVLPQAMKQVRKLSNLYPPVFRKSKRLMRRQLLEVIDRDINAMVDDIIKDASDPFVLQSAQMFLASLKK